MIQQQNPKNKTAVFERIHVFIGKCVATALNMLLACDCISSDSLFVTRSLMQGS